MKNRIRRLFGMPQVMPRKPISFSRVGISGDDFDEFTEFIEICAEKKLDYQIHSSLQKETITTTMCGVTKKYIRFGYGSMFYTDENGKTGIVGGKSISYNKT